MALGLCQQQSNPSFGTLPLGGFETLSPSPHGNPRQTGYVYALNKALQLEQTAVSLSVATQRSQKGRIRAGASFIDRIDLHQKAQRQLVRLIFAQRGFPDTDPASLTAITGTVAARVCRYMPTVFQEPLLDLSTHQIERALVQKYSELLSLAPVGDQVVLKSLLNQCQRKS